MKHTQLLEAAKAAYSEKIAREEEIIGHFSNQIGLDIYQLFAHRMSVLVTCCWGK